MSSYRGRALTEAIIAALSTAGLNVGDGEKPAGVGWQGTPGTSNFKGYVVVHPVGGFDIDGTLDQPSDDVWPMHQLTSYGATRAQCEEIADDAREAMMTIPAAVVGSRKVARWRIDLVGVVTRVDTVQPAIFMAPDRYTTATTP